MRYGGVMTPIVRLAAPQDLPDLVALLTKLFAEEADFAPEPARQRRGLAAILAAPEAARILVAEHDGRCIGMVSLLSTISTAEGGPAAWLEDMVVHPDFRGAGVGSLLLAAALDDCRGRGVTRVTLLTDRANTRAQELYERHGFVGSEMIPMRRHL